MNCQDARLYWNLYYDSEGTPDQYLQVNRHLQRCPHCADWFNRQELLEDELTRRVAAGDETPELWAAILPTAKSKLASFGSGGRTLSLILALSVCVVVAAGLMISRRANGKPQHPDLAALTMRVHSDLYEGRRKVEFQSGSDLKIEDYLRKRVSFPVRCPPRRDSGFFVDGAGICRLAGCRAAYLTGEVNGDAVSIFILSHDHLQRFPQHRQALESGKTIDCRNGEYRMTMAAIDRNLVLVVGRADCDQLKRVLKAYGTYPHDPGG